MNSTKTNGEALVSLLQKNKVQMGEPPNIVCDGAEVVISISRAWFDKPLGVRRCAQCGEWFKAKRVSSKYCERCAKQRKLEAINRHHASEPYYTYHKVVERLRRRGENPNEFISEYKNQINDAEKLRIAKKWDEKTKRR